MMDEWQSDCHLKEWWWMDEITLSSEGVMMAGRDKIVIWRSDDGWMRADCHLKDGWESACHPKEWWWIDESQIVIWRRDDGWMLDEFHQPHWMFSSSSSSSSRHSEGNWLHFRAFWLQLREPRDRSRGAATTDWTSSLIEIGRIVAFFRDSKRVSKAKQKQTGSGKKKKPKANHVFCRWFGCCLKQVFSLWLVIPCFLRHYFKWANKMQNLYNRYMN